MTKHNINNILHIAGFNGNIGDIANHDGFKNSLIKFFPERKFEFEDLEMRTFYKLWGINKFDLEFVSQANNYDLVVFGGGGFFDLRWDYSSTGTTIDLAEEVMDKIEVPILLNGIGYSEGKAAKRLECRFRKFLRKILSDEKYFVTVRNDGSYQAMLGRYGDMIKEKLIEIPDGGFFCLPKKSGHPEIVKGCMNVAINVAGDAIGDRFAAKDDAIGLEGFIREMTLFIRRLAEKDLQIRFIFVPHIYSDLRIISDILGNLPDYLARSRVTCAPYLNGTYTDGLINFDLYRECDLVIGMRYHANVVPIGLGVPTIAICTLDKIMKLYEKLGIGNRCIQGNQMNFSEELLKLAVDVLQNQKKYLLENKRIKDVLEKENNAYMLALKNWLGLMESANE